jgi:hypothetical protein
VLRACVIRRIDDWEGKTFIESQSDATVGMFYLAVALYALLLIPNTLAIVNQIFLFIKVVRCLSHIYHRVNILCGT